MDNRLYLLAAMLVGPVVSWKAGQAAVNNAWGWVKNNERVYRVYGQLRAALQKHVLPSQPFGASKILDGLFLGDIWDAHNFVQLKEQGITHILVSTPFFYACVLRCGGLC